MYYIEYKTVREPYHYEFFSTKNEKPIMFSSIKDARKNSISMIVRRIAILTVIRGGTEQLVYGTKKGGFVLEDRPNKRWYHLRSDGTLGKRITNLKGIGLIQSIWDM